MKPIEKGDSVRYFDVLGRDKFTEHQVEEIYPNGIPSCRQPMAKLSNKSGVVLLSHCFSNGSDRAAVVNGVRKKAAVFAEELDRDTLRNRNLYQSHEVCALLDEIDQLTLKYRELKDLHDKDAVIVDMNARDQLKKEIVVLRNALKKLTLGWLYWPAKRQPDPKATMFESRTINEIEAMAKQALVETSFQGELHEIELVLCRQLDMLRLLRESKPIPLEFIESDLKKALAFFGRPGSDAPKDMAKKG